MRSGRESSVGIQRNGHSDGSSSDKEQWQPIKFQALYTDHCISSSQVPETGTIVIISLLQMGSQS